MKQEEKQLLLKDLCARLPFHKTICKIGEYSDYILRGIDLSNESQPLIIELNKEQFPAYLEHVKPYLRPMSSITEEEAAEFEILSDKLLMEADNTKIWNSVVDWLDAHHFDHRGLIPMGLALEATEEMYKEE